MLLHFCLKNVTQQLLPINSPSLSATYLQVTFLLLGHRDKGKDEKSFLTSLQDSLQNQQFCDQSLSSTGRSLNRKGEEGD